MARMNRLGATFESPPETILEHGLMVKGNEVATFSHYAAMHPFVYTSHHDPLAMSGFLER